ncbi:Glutamyl-tRNA(Gln) amidotransferase subunit C, chloroplastic/mitochondrial-like protein, partial [Drosera capensis]
FFRFGQLQAVDLGSVEPAIRAGTEGENLREDVAEVFANREGIIVAIPSYEEPYIKVPKYMRLVARLHSSGSFMVERDALQVMRRKIFHTPASRDCARRETKINCFGCLNYDHPEYFVLETISSSFLLIVDMPCIKPYRR